MATAQATDNTRTATGRCFASPSRGGSAPGALALRGASGSGSVRDALTWRWPARARGELSAAASQPLHSWMRDRAARALEQRARGSLRAAKSGQHSWLQSTQHARREGNRTHHCDGRRLTHAEGVWSPQALRLKQLCYDLLRRLTTHCQRLCESSRTRTQWQHHTGYTRSASVCLPVQRTLPSYY